MTSIGVQISPRAARTLVSSSDIPLITQESGTSYDTDTQELIESYPRVPYADLDIPDSSRMDTGIHWEIAGITYPNYATTSLGGHERLSFRTNERTNERTNDDWTIAAPHPYDQVPLSPHYDPFCPVVGGGEVGVEGVEGWNGGGQRMCRSLEDLPRDIQDHILRCQCSCDHLGYGNFSTASLSRLTNGCSAHMKKLSAHPINTETIHSSSSSTTTASSKLKDVGGSGGGTGVRGRVWVCVAVVLAGVAGVGVGVPLALRVDPEASLPQRLTTAKDLLRETPLVDGHNDLPWNIRKFMHNRLHSFNFTAELKKLRPWSRSSWSHTDLPRLKEGMVGAQFWVSYVPCESQLLNAVQLTIEQIDLIKRLIDQYPEHLKLVTSAHEVEDAFNEGLIASLIGVEGGHAIQNSLGVLRALRELGVRYLTLTHTCSTPWAECARSKESDEEDPNAPRGLTQFGKVRAQTVVKEMNRLGILVDLSHVSQATMREALEVSRAPVIFSHSSVYAICKNPRNVPDDILEKVANNGGIVMISFYNFFLTCSKDATISDVIEHINHVRKVAGVDHVGIGADFDGINLLPEGLKDVSGYPNLFAELLSDPTWSNDDLTKLAGRNLLRVMRAAEQVRLELKDEGILPYEEEVPITAGDHEACFYRFLRPPDSSE